jgi:hypothetical protein
MNSWGSFELYRQRAQELEEQRKPQPVQTTWAIGSKEWLAEQNTSKAEHAEQNKSKAEKLKPPKPVHARVKEPPGIGAVQTLSGRRITIAEDRIVEMSAEDANCLIPAGWTLLTE